MRGLPRVDATSSGFPGATVLAVGHRLVKLAHAGVVLLLAVLGVFVAGCGSSLAGQGALSSMPASSDATQPAAVTSSRSGYGGDGIPMPWVDGGYTYLGHGHFVILSGSQDFFWRDGHFVNPDGTLFLVPERIQQTLKAKGLPVPDHQPTAAEFSPDLGKDALSGMPLTEALWVVGHELSAQGWWVTDTRVDSQQLLGLTFVVTQGENDPFVDAVLERAVLLARKRGLPIEDLHVETQDQQGTVVASSDYPAALLDPLTSRLWSAAPAAPDATQVEGLLKSRLPKPEQYPGVSLRSLTVTSSYLESRKVEVVFATSGPDVAPSAVTGYSAALLDSVERLNQDEKTGIAVLRFDAVDPSGVALLRDRHDLDLGQSTDEYTSSDYLPASGLQPAVTTATTGVSQGPTVTPFTLGTADAFIGQPGNAPTPGTYLRDDIPLPMVDSAVEGGFRYLGNGRFVVESGREFFWGNGRFVNADGSPLEIPARVRKHLHDLGVDQQPSAVVTHYSAPNLHASPKVGVSLAVKLSQWTEDRVCATVEIRNDSGAPFRFGNRDLQLDVNGVRMEQTNPALELFEVAGGAGTEFRTEVYFIVPQFNASSSEIVYAPSSVD